MKRILAATMLALAASSAHATIPQLRNHFTNDLAAEVRRAMQQNDRNNMVSVVTRCAGIFLSYAALYLEHGTADEHLDLAINYSNKATSFGILAAMILEHELGYSNSRAQQRSLQLMENSQEIYGKMMWESYTRLGHRASEPLITDLRICNNTAAGNPPS